jgi:hypothetical protein
VPPRPYAIAVLRYSSLTDERNAAWAIAGASSALYPSVQLRAALLGRGALDAAALERAARDRGDHDDERRDELSNA